MGGTKRMSAEEKRKVILSIYHKDQQVYTEKEIFALVAKAGVSANSIADIHQEMVDDGLVDKAKIGGSNYFWSFKGKTDRLAQIQNEKTLKLIEELKPQVAEAEAQLSDAKRGREESDDDDEFNDEGGEGVQNQSDKIEGNDDKMEDEGCITNDSSTKTNITNKKGGLRGRAKKLARLSELKTKKVELEKELEKLKENDPAALADLEKELMFVKQSAHRWTDNIFECKSYLLKKRGMDRKDVNRILQISEDFDYPEDP